MAETSASPRSASSPSSSSGAERRRELTARLTEALGDLALGCAEGEARTLTWDDLTQVSAFDVRASALCQASVAAQPEPFETHPALLTRHLALTAGRRIHRTGGSPTEAVRAAMAEAMEAERWPGPWLREQPRDVRTLCATKAITWLGRTMDVLEVTDLRRWQFARDLNWSFPGRGLKLKAKLDLMRPDAVPVVVATSTAPHAMDQVAFIVLLTLVNDLRPIDEAVVVVHSSGERISIDPDTMIDRGVEAARTALEAVLEQAISGPDAVEPPLHLAARASLFGCRACPFVKCSHRHRPDDPNIDGDERPTVTRGGLRLPA